MGCLPRKDYGLAALLNFLCLGPHDAPSVGEPKGVTAPPFAMLLFVASIIFLSSDRSLLSSRFLDMEGAVLRSRGQIPHLYLSGPSR